MHRYQRAWRGLGLGLALLSLASGVQAVIITKQLTGTPSTLLSLTNLANNAWSTAGSNFNNAVGGGGGDGFLLCELQGAFTFAGSPAAGTAVQVMLLRSQDGSTFEDLSTSTVKLGRLPNVTLPVTSGQATTKVTLEVKCPPGIFKAQALNDGTGQQLNSGTISIRMITLEGI